MAPSQALQDRKAFRNPLDYHQKIKEETLVLVPKQQQHENPRKSENICQNKKLPR
jgi:hypothetical protein